MSESKKRKRQLVGSGDGVRRIRLPEVLNRTGLNKRTLYRRIQERKFPEPIKDGRISFWWLGQVQEYLGIDNGGLLA
jgi:predicted DNA-binding transcriptional regulator AlpA